MDVLCDYDDALCGRARGRAAARAHRPRPVPAARSARHVVVAGFVGEEEKRAAFAGALALVNPSALESLSLALLEAWREGTPGLVNAHSDVMREHLARCGGGLAFGTYEEFREALDALAADPERSRAMGEAGRAYVLEEYGWPAVRARLHETVERLA